ncbi:NADPH:quinone oxidoreductase family protein [Roseibaca sp. Y0-43]|uniref:NADPH:quinone oxidoreductase family protein n=1 Tax=Roseibaca sp. Y0-43 TaxID=2816854 RepID=UPI001D0C8BC5|nr:NADPH:quinone oxidoreductase family protein [Roseibaca sp. Y0-43]MCC1481578.1 NADPH:quinone oxidoreductase family protein [Roseibaca sp. Y0-43]
MRAIQLHDYDSTPVLGQIDRPEPGPGEVLVRVAACGLNFADLLMMQGKYQEKVAPPYTLGMEYAGTVEALGAGVTHVSLGDRVAVFAGRGGLADYAVCNADLCAHMPADMPFADAAAFLVAYGTSHLALAHRANLQPGETLVVLGAAGGVGLTAVEIGARMGARVVAVARGADKLEVARNAGAEICFDSGAEGFDLRAELKALGGAHVIYDAIGEPLATPAMRALHPEGRFLAIGFAGGTPPAFPANILLVKNLSVIGLYWGAYMKFAPKVMAGSIQTLFDWYATGSLRPHISHLLPLEQALEGLELLRARKSTGKIVITI